MFDRLAQFLGWCAERGLYAQPSLFVGWMSGGTFWPEWKAGRNLFADPFMVERSAAFARRAAEVIAPFDGHLLGIDQGNEICCLLRQLGRAAAGGDRLVPTDQRCHSQRLPAGA